MRPPTADSSPTDPAPTGPERPRAAPRNPMAPIPPPWPSPAQRGQPGLIRSDDAQPALRSPHPHLSSGAGGSARRCLTPHNSSPLHRAACPVLCLGNINLRPACPGVRPALGPHSRARRNLGRAALPTAPPPWHSFLSRPRAAPPNGRLGSILDQPSRLHIRLGHTCRAGKLNGLSLAAEPRPGTHDACPCPKALDRRTARRRARNAGRKCKRSLNVHRQVLEIIGIEWAVHVDTTGHHAH